MLGFSEAQESFRLSVREFARREFGPGAHERAKLDYVPKEQFKKLGDFGLLGLNMSEEYGGRPSDWVTAGIAVEEVAKVDNYVAGPWSFVIGANLALKNATEELRQEWLPSLISGDKAACVAMTEPGCGSDAAAIRTRAIRDGDHYVITGEKTCITRGMQADVAVLFAKTDPQAGARGVTCFLLPLDLPGIHKQRLPHAGCLPLGAAGLGFDEVRLPARNKIGEEGKGFYIVMGAFDFLRGLQGIHSTALAQASLDDTIAFVRQRKAFGQPIAKHQSVSFKIAEAATRIDASRYIAFRVLRLKDQGLPHTKEAAMSKWFCTEVAFRVIRDMITIHGVEGYSEALPLERRLRDDLGFEVVEGSQNISKLIIARDLIGKEFV